MWDIQHIFWCSKIGWVPGWWGQKTWMDKFHAKRTDCLGENFCWTQTWRFILFSWQDSYGATWCAFGLFKYIAIQIRWFSYHSVNSCMWNFQILVKIYKLLTIFVSWIWLLIIIVGFVVMMLQLSFCID